MQFKRGGGWQYSEADGVVTMPGNARQAFPAKRDAAGRTRGGLEKGGEETETIIQYVRGVQVVYCVFAFTQFSTRFTRDITQSRFIQRDATRRGSHRPIASLYLIPGKLQECLHENAANNREFPYISYFFPRYYQSDSPTNSISYRDIYPRTQSFES